MERSKFRYMYTSWLVFLTLVLTVSTSHLPKPRYHKQLYELTDIANPRTNFAECGRISPSWVCDPAGILEESEAFRIDNEITKTIEDTKCPCSQQCPLDSNGYIISVVLLPKIKVSPGYNVSTELKRWGQELSTRLWKFGTCGNDLIILISLGDAAQVTVYANSSVLTKVSEASCQRDFLANCRLYLHAGRYGEAIRQTVAGIRNIFLGKPCQFPPVSEYFEKVSNDHEVQDGIESIRHTQRDRGKTIGLRLRRDYDNNRYIHYQEEEDQAAMGVTINGTHYAWWIVLLIVLGIIAVIIGLAIALCCCCCGALCC
ncbi:uncharacterized protein LOC106151588 [Lingula anatina]|uniref:Uncharacterized protein LOC106151588 n=1 Tax=Lingula anatina TaxID=7574 RepID=A0A1S3H2Z0_LINAN|nr:uncharacterized protein LOC106151588 [Lingula anatina]|eukprot:XP_013380378.1 uncharacterized protein LOC106151588 [Lingula anatina]